MLVRGALVKESTDALASHSNTLRRRNHRGREARSLYVVARHSRRVDGDFTNARDLSSGVRLFRIFHILEPSS
jgi:hypothetical protein